MDKPEPDKPVLPKRHEPSPRPALRMYGGFFETMRAEVVKSLSPRKPDDEKPVPSNR